MSNSAQQTPHKLGDTCPCGFIYVTAVNGEIRCKRDLERFRALYGYEYGERHGKNAHED